MNQKLNIIFFELRNAFINVFIEDSDFQIKVTIPLKSYLNSAGKAPDHTDPTAKKQLLKYITSNPINYNGIIREDAALSISEAFAAAKETKQKRFNQIS